MQRERPPPPKTWQQQSKRYKTKYMNALKSLYGDTFHAQEGSDTQNKDRIPPRKRRTD